MEWESAEHAWKGAAMLGGFGYPKKAMSRPWKGGQKAVMAQCIQNIL